jgi:pyruvate-formate lyase-activating enzyme
VSARVLLDLAGAVATVADGDQVRVPVADRKEAELAARWCRRAGHRFLAWDGKHVQVRRGRPHEPFAELPEELRPARRLWLYTNFDCNLACSYCCVSSSPGAPRRPLSLDLVRAVVAEAPAVGTRQLYLTGGEPFLLPEIGAIVGACAAVLPTTILTNGMLFRGPRRGILDALPRNRVTLQVSLDSATPALHDANRGMGTHARALAGIVVAMGLGFRVRVAATLGPGRLDEETALHELCDGLGVPRGDRVIRRIARQGAASEGVVVTRESLVPELCLTADGIWWHPLVATDPAMLVTRRLLPLADAVEAAAEEFAGHRRRGRELAVRFPCA